MWAARARRGRLAGERDHLGGRVAQDRDHRLLAAQLRLELLGVARQGVEPLLIGGRDRPADHDRGESGGHGSARRHRPDGATSTRQRAHRQAVQAGRRDALHERAFTAGGASPAPRRPGPRSPSNSRSAARLGVAARRSVSKRARSSASSPERVRRRQLADLSRFMWPTPSPRSAPRSRSSRGARASSRCRAARPAGRDLRCVRPSKNASSMTRRCGSGSWARAVCTRLRSSATTPDSRPAHRRFERRTRPPASWPT